GPANGLNIERALAAHAPGRVTVDADVFRPADERPAPPLIAWSPYGKHAGSQVTERYPDGGVAPGQLSGYAAFESPDPWSIAATNPPHLAAINPWEGLERHLPGGGPSRRHP